MRVVSGRPFVFQHGLLAVLSCLIFLLLDLMLLSPQALASGEIIVSEIWKNPHPEPPGYLEPNPTQPTAVVPGMGSVPITLHFRGLNVPAEFGTDIVFLIDNSGSMTWNDPNGKRFQAIKDLVTLFAPERNTLDRIAIVLFSESHSTLIQPWSTWNQAGNTVTNLIASANPTGETPMAHGINLAINLLSATTGIYRLVILLSDGEPTPDDLTSRPSATITGSDLPLGEESLVDRAFRNRILISTVALSDQDPPPVNSLLSIIARRTDYITNYLSPADPPRYYFSVANPDGIQAAYQELLNDIFIRLTPQAFRLREKINSLLIVDPDAPLGFAGSGLVQDQNIVGYGQDAILAGVTSLEEALDYFCGTGLFEIYLNELNGDVSLDFSVKLNIEGLDPANYPDDRICVEVDDQPGVQSFIEYLRPLDDGRSEVERRPTPQATVCFKKGLDITKTHLTTGGKESIRLDIGNMDLVTKTNVEFAEFPSGFITTSAPNDDIDFAAFDALLNGAISDWFVDKAIIQARHVYPQYDLLPQIAKPKIRNLITQKVQNGLAPLYDDDEDLDLLFSEFQFVENPPEPAGLHSYWRTVNQRGFYRMIPSFGPLETRYLEFQFAGGSFAKPGEPAGMINWYLDALFPKWGIVFTKSWYRSDGMANSKMIEPDPLFYQYVSTESRPEIFVSTCFREQDVKSLGKLFNGTLSANESWDLLDSLDIEPIWDKSSYEQSVKITVHNDGTEECSATVRARTVFICWTGRGFTVDLAHETASYTSGPILVGNGSTTVSNIPPGGRKECTIRFMKLYHLGQDMHYATPALLAVVKDLVAVTKVQIETGSGEKYLTNNKGVEAVRIEGL